MNEGEATYLGGGSSPQSLSHGVVHKGRLQKKLSVFLPLPPVRRCPHLTNHPSPPCGRRHLTLYTALWSGSVIAGAVDIPHLTSTPGGLICGSSKLPRPESKRGVVLSANPYYTLWHKSHKMNNLQFILGITLERVSAKHPGIIKKKYQ